MGSSDGPNSPIRRLFKVVGSVGVMTVAVLLAGSILIDPDCFECVGPGQIIGSLVAFAAVNAIGLWLIWRA